MADIAEIIAWARQGQQLLGVEPWQILEAVTSWQDGPKAAPTQHRQDLLSDLELRRALGDISRTTLHRLKTDDPEFPRPVPLRPGGSSRYFVRAEVDNYVKRLIQRRDEEGATPTVIARGQKLNTRKRSAAAAPHHQE
jgi:predicted DNA-binding transcriptional regulator AlpA